MITPLSLLWTRLISPEAIAGFTALCCLASLIGCSGTHANRLTSNQQLTKLPHLSEDAKLLEHIQALKGSLKRASQPTQALNMELLQCLTALVPRDRNLTSASRLSPRSALTADQQTARVQPEIGTRCVALLSRPAERAEGLWLSDEWLLVDVRESVHLSLSVPSAKYAASLLSARRAQWTLEATLLRLPRTQDRANGLSARQDLSAKGGPASLSSWSDARLERATLSAWGAYGVHTEMVSLSKEATLKQLPLPRVGQAVTIKLSRPTPHIQRGAWATHIPLWFNSPVLRRSLTVTLPTGAQLSLFGPNPQERQRLAHEERVRWVQHLVPRGEGEVIYVSTTDSWPALNRWLWSQLYQHHPAYQRALSRHLATPPLDQLLSKTSNAELHRWITEHFGYQPDSARPYLPLPPQELLRRRAGDCKDLSLLSLSLLELQGLRPRFALTSTRPLPKYAQEIPSIGWFDHVLLWVPDQQTDLLALHSARAGIKLLDAPLARYHWFDPTSPHITPQTSARFAYVLLGPEHGVWVPIKPEEIR